MPQPVSLAKTMQIAHVAIKYKQLQTTVVIKQLCCQWYYAVVINEVTLSYIDKQHTIKTIIYDDNFWNKQEHSSSSSNNLTSPLPPSVA